MASFLRTTTSRTVLRSSFQKYTLPARYLRPASTMSHSVPKLKDPSLLKLDVAYVNGEWVKAKSGKTFEVTGMAVVENRRKDTDSYQTHPQARSLELFQNSMPRIHNLQSMPPLPPSPPFERRLVASDRSCSGSGTI